MASISTDANGNRTIQIVCPDKKRRSIRLGQMTLKKAEKVKTRIEELSSARRSRTPLEDEVATWLGKIDDTLYARIVAVGLAEPRHKSTAVETTLNAFADQFIAGNADKAAGTLIHYRQAKGLLVEFFGADKPLASVTRHDANQFRSWLKGTKKTKSKKPLAENTVRGHLKNAKLYSFEPRIRHNHYLQSYD